MRKLVVLLLIISVKAICQNNYPCVPDSLMMSYLNSKSSYGSFSDGPFLKFTLFDDPIDKRPRYSYTSSCLSNQAKAKIYSLLAGEPYDFEKELNAERVKYYGPNSDWAKYKLEFTFKYDTTRLAEKLDSLYQPMRAAELKRLKNQPYSNAIIYFIGKAYFYEAIPKLKSGLQDSAYIKRRGVEDTQQTLAKLGDKYWVNYYYELFKIPVKTERELGDRVNIVRYINDPYVFRAYYETEFKNETETTVNYSDTSVTRKTWQWVIDIFITASGQIKELQKEKFGKSLYDMIYPGNGQYNRDVVYTEEIRKGMLEILRDCNYECLVDYSLKPKEKSNR